MSTPSKEELLGRIGPLVGEVSALDMPPGGDVGALRAVLRTAAGPVFAKWAFSPPAVACLRNELAVLVHHPSLGPLVRDIDDTDQDLVVVVDHLDDDGWATPAQLDRARETLDAMASLTPPAALPHLESGVDPWNGVDPANLGVLGEWLERWQPSLAVAAGGVDLAGNHLVHGDLDIAHVWIGPARTLLVDWEFAAVGNPGLDRATLALDALRCGVGPGALDVEPQWPAYLAGVMASAIQSGPPAAAREPIREANRRIALLETALRWAASSLGLAPPPGS